MITFVVSLVDLSDLKERILTDDHYRQMARMVSTKAALCVRLDALADEDSKSLSDSQKIGLEWRVKLESRLRHLENSGGGTRGGGGGGKGGKFEWGEKKGGKWDGGGDLIPTATTGKGKEMEVVSGFEGCEREVGKVD
jgi:hypothetical protein